MVKVTNSRRNFVFKFMFALVLIFLIGESLSAALEQKTIRVGIYQNPPKVFVDRNGVPAGFFVDLINEIARQEKWQVKFLVNSWPENLDLLLKGEIDLLPDVGFTEAREKIYDLNKEPVVSDWFQVFSNGQIKVSNILDLKNHRIAILASSIQLDFMKNLMKNLDQKYDLIEKNDYDEIFNAVAQGEADLLLTNRFAGKFLAPKYGVKDTPLIFNPTSLHFATTKGFNGSILNTVDQYLKKWKADHKSFYYHKLEANLNQNTIEIIPGWLMIILKSLLGLFITSAIFVILFKYKLKQRTAELCQTNVQLEDALTKLKVAYEKAVTQERLNMLGQMASGISHDFNNILMPINGLTELLLADDEILDDKKTVKQYLQTILDAGKDGTELVQRMRDFYRQREKKLEKTLVDLNELIDGVIVLAAPKWKEQTQKEGRFIELVFEKGEISPISACQSQIREILINLIFNAVDAMPKGGIIKLRTSEKDGQVSIFLEDNGTGMTPEVLENCLKPFYSTKGEKGTGMGLSMVKEICETHSGKLAVFSELDQGTKFQLSFPVDSHNGIKHLEEFTKSEFDSLRLLIVDDNLRTLEVARIVLQAQGHKISCETSPMAALNLAISNDFDLIITDFSMPEMTGLRLIKEVRKVKPLQKFVVLTGSYCEDSAAEFANLKVPVLEKPLKIKIFNENVHNLLCS